MVFLNIVVLAKFCFSERLGSILGIRSTIILKDVKSIIAFHYVLCNPKLAHMPTAICHNRIDEVKLCLHKSISFMCVKCYQELRAFLLLTGTASTHSAKPITFSVKLSSAVKLNLFL